MTDRTRRRLEQVEAAVAVVENQSKFDMKLVFVSPDGTRTSKMLSELTKEWKRGPESTERKTT